MNSTESTELRDPDTFSADLHYCLLSQGLRSKRLRALLRLARGNGELERIFETKVNEFRRYLRETRVPTAWNLPIRTIERFTDNARFTPPREVLTTVAYVIFAVVGIDAAKSWLPWDRNVTHPESPTHMVVKKARFDVDSDELWNSTPVPGDTTAKVDDWLEKELRRATESPEWQRLLAERLKSTTASISFDSEKMETALKGAVQQWFSSDEFKQMAADAVRKAVGSRPLRDDVASSGENVTPAGATP